MLSAFATEIQSSAVYLLGPGELPKNVHRTQKWAVQSREGDI
jgi:hypothetical protein